MVRWGLGICAAVFAVMLLIPVPLRPDSYSQVESRAPQAARQNLSAIAAPRAGAALMSLPDAGPAEVPAPDRLDAASIAATSAPLIPSETLPEPSVDRTLLVPALAIRPVKPAPEAYRVAAPKADLRAGPSSLERSTALLAEGDRVEVLSRFADRWVFVRLADGTTEGYLDVTLLSPAD